MKEEQECDDGKRIRLPYGEDEYIYLFHGKKFIEATIPFENRPENLRTRGIVDTICNKATRVNGRRN